MTAPRLALFDLDNTLVDRAGAFRTWVGLLAERLALSADDMRWVVDFDDDGKANRDALFAALRDRFDLPESPEQLRDGYWAEYLTCFRRDPEVVASIRLLQREGWKVGVVTNGSHWQITKMENAGLVDVVDAWCISAEVGSAKPEREIFDEVARRCGTSLSGWMVGDTERADILGGRQAGLNTIWMARGRTWDIAEYRPDATANTISEAAELILDAVH